MASPLVNTDYRIPMTELVSGTDTYVLALAHALNADHAITLFLGNSDPEGRTDEANEHFCLVVPPIAGATTLTIEREKAAPASTLELVVRVMECTDNTSAEGFTLRSSHQLVFLAGDLTKTAAHVGVVDDGQVQVISGGYKSAATGAFEKSRGLARLRHTATDVEASRISSGQAMEATAFVIEWGSGVTVELVEFSSASMTVGGDLADLSDWETDTITSVVSANAFLSATFTTKNSSNPGNYAESLVCVLGDGVGLDVNETKIAVGSWKGGVQTEGWVYVVSHPNWFVSRFVSDHGVFVDFETTSKSLLIFPPAGSESYSTVSDVDRMEGSRLVRSNQSCEYQNTSEFYLSQHVMMITAGTTLEYTRANVKGPPTDPYGDGFLMVEIVDFNGSPFGDPGDIDGSASTASIDRSHSIIADGLDVVKLIVTVKDSANKIVQNTGVTVRLGDKDPQNGTTNSVGTATFFFTSEEAGTFSIRIFMGDDGVAMPILPLVTFVAVPTNHLRLEATNLGNISDFAAGDPFIDLMLAGRAAQTIPYSGGSHDQAKEDFDANGWQMSALQSVDRIQYYISTNDAKNRGAGQFVINYDPGGLGVTEFGASGVTIDSHVLGRMVVTHDGSTLWGVYARSNTRDITPANYPKNFVITALADELTYNRDVNLWRQEFLDSVAAFKHFRFMDWGHTNNSYIRNWSDRAGVDTQSVNRVIYDTDFPAVARHLGMPYEWMFDLCTRVGANAQLNIPHRAVDGYGTNLATLAILLMDIGLVVEFEYTNEAWNPLFRQQAYREDLRIAYALPDTTEGRHAAYATRACEFFVEIDAVYGTSLERRRNILGAQSGSPVTLTNIAGADVSTGTTLTGNAASYATAIKTAPYIGRNVAEAAAAAAFAALTADLDVVFHVTTGEVALAVANLALIDPVLPLEHYEGGMHLTVQGIQTEAVVTDTNRLPGMQGLLTAYMIRVDGRRMAYFSNIYNPNSSGSWGLIEGLDDFPLAASAGNYKRKGWDDYFASLEAIPPAAYSSIIVAEATGAVPLLDGYVKQARGNLMQAFISFCEFPVVGKVTVIVLRDGPAGAILAQIPLSDTPTGTALLAVPLQLENGIYVTGLGALSGDERVDLQFLFHDLGVAPAAQDFPR